MNDKVFVKESYKILNGTALFKDGSVDEVKNVQVYSKINVDPWVEELKNEIERLKAENESLKIIDENLREVKENFEKSYIRKLEENQQLKAENAKLKCLVLHAMSYAVVSLTSNTNKFKPFRLFVKYNDAYRKAKAELKETK